MENYTYDWNMRTMVWRQINDRWSIFIFIGVCAGLPALVWSASDLIHHRKNGHRISAFIILLLLTDSVEIFLSPVILVKLFSNEFFRSRDWTFSVSVSLWFSLRLCGLLLNQLVALEGILSVKYPLYTASVFSSHCFTFYILVFLCVIISYVLLFLFRFLYLFKYYLLVDLSVFIISVITWIISSFALCCTDRHSRTSRKPDRHIWVVFIFTLLVLYLPNVLFSLFLVFAPYFLQPHHVWLIPHFLGSVRLISDPLVCVLVCRQNLSVQTSQPDRTSLV